MFLPSNCFQELAVLCNWPFAFRAASTPWSLLPKTGVSPGNCAPKRNNRGIEQCFTHGATGGVCSQSSVCRISHRTSGAQMFSANGFQNSWGQRQISKHVMELGAKFGVAVLFTQSLRAELHRRLWVGGMKFSVTNIWPDVWFILFTGLWALKKGCCVFVIVIFKAYSALSCLLDLDQALRFNSDVLVL